MFNSPYRNQFSAFPCQIIIDSSLESHWIVLSETDALFLFTETFAADSPVSVASRFDLFFERFPEGIILIPGYPHHFSSLPATLYQFVVGSLLYQAIQKHRILPVRQTDVGLVIYQYAKRVQFPRDHHAQGRYKPKMESVVDQRLFLLEGLINCGEKKSEVLLEQFPNPYHFLNTLLTTPEKILQIKGFGPDFITSNTRLLRADFFDDEQEDSPCD